LVDARRAHAVEYDPQQTNDRFAPLIEAPPDFGRRRLRVNSSRSGNGGFPVGPSHCQGNIGHCQAFGPDYYM